MNYLWGVKFKVLGLLLAGGAAFSAHSLRIPGSVEGFGPMKTDNIVDGAMVLRSFRPADIIAFRIDQFLAPNEDMKAGPQTVSVPGNFFIPSQKEKWGLFRIELNKSEFGHYTEAGERDELVALSFQAPFKAILDMALGDGLSPSKLLPIINIKKYDFKADADHSRSSRLNFNLDKGFSNRYAYNWDRSAPPADAGDHIFSFQQTPMNRWILADLQGNVGPYGSIKTAEGLPQTSKVLFTRVFESNNAVYRILANVRNSDDLAQTVNGLASPLANLRIDGSKVRWQAPASEGWVAVMIERRKAFKVSTSPFAAFSLRNFFPPKELVESTWVNPADGVFDLSSLGGDPSAYSVTVIFVGTELPTERPDTDDGESLFSEMRSLAVEVLQ